MKFLALTLALTVASSAMAVSTVKGSDGKTYRADAGNVTVNTSHDDLIRGEMAAVETYTQVLEKVKDKTTANKLIAIRKNHMDAVAVLKKYANSEIKSDAKDSGAWGEFAQAFTGSAKLVGNETAVKALRRGEEHGISEYKEALEDKKVNLELKEVIRTKLLPATEGHIKTINTLI